MSDLEALRVEMREKIGEMRRRNDERHTEASERHKENVSHLERIDDAQHALKKAIDDHATSDLAELGKLHNELKENTAATKDIVILLKFGRGSVTFAKGLAEVAKWLGVMAFGFGLCYALYLWIVGRGPFPPIGHP